MNSPDQNVSIEQLLSSAAQQISSISGSARLDVELLLCEVLDCNRTYLFTWSDKTVSGPQVILFRQLLERRAKGEPIAHIVGRRGFWDLELNVNASTLIPRPDTEILVEKVLDVVAQDGPCSGQGLDLGCGTGAIALALGQELPNWHWLGADLIDDAVALAQSNAKRNHITNCRFIQSSWFENIGLQKFDFIVSNPPYIDKNDPHLSQGDVRFEPLTALVAEDNGLADIKLISQLAPNYLNPNAKLIFEHGYDQGQSVRKILSDNNFQKVETFKDLSGNDRVSIGYF